MHRMTKQTNFGLRLCLVWPDFTFGFLLAFPGCHLPFPILHFTPDPALPPSPPLLFGPPHCLVGCQPADLYALEMPKATTQPESTRRTTFSKYVHLNYATPRHLPLWIRETIPLDFAYSFPRIRISSWS